MVCNALFLFDFLYYIFRASRVASQYMAKGYWSVGALSFLKSLPIPEWQRNGRSRYEERIREQQLSSSSFKYIEYILEYVLLSDYCLPLSRRRSFGVKGIQ